MTEKPSEQARNALTGVSAGSVVDACPVDQAEEASAGLSQDVAAWMSALVGSSVGDLSRAGMIEEMAALERLKNATAARQARLAVVFNVAERQAQAAAGVPVRRQGRGVAEQIALARRESPYRAAAFLARSITVCVDMPATMTRFVAGELSEYRAGLIAAEVALLEATDRAEVDALLNPGLTASPGSSADAQEGDPQYGDITAMSDRAVKAAAAAAAYRVDPSVILRRGRHAESERFVSLRPAPDTMTYLSAYLPVRQGVACWASLRQAADAARAAGDPRSRGQVMADVLVARLTGAEHAGQIPLELQLVLTDKALLADTLDAAEEDIAAGAFDDLAAEAVTDCGADLAADTVETATDTADIGMDAAEEDTGDGDHHGDGVDHGAGRSAFAENPLGCFGAAAGAEAERPCGLRSVAAGSEPAYLAGYGPIANETARAWLREHLDAGGKLWIRRLLTDPISGQAVAIDARARFFRLRCGG